jgi:hypothetical protein
LLLQKSTIKHKPAAQTRTQKRKPPCTRVYCQEPKMRCVHHDQRTALTPRAN